MSKSLLFYQWQLSCFSYVSLVIKTKTDCSGSCIYIFMSVSRIKHFEPYIFKVHCHQIRSGRHERQCRHLQHLHTPVWQKYDCQGRNTLLLAETSELWQSNSIAVEARGSMIAWNVFSNQLHNSNSIAHDQSPSLKCFQLGVKFTNQCDMLAYISPFHYVLIVYYQVRFINGVLSSAAMLHSQKLQVSGGQNLSDPLSKSNTLCGHTFW